MSRQVILLAFMCFLNFWDRPIFKEVMNIYVIQSQSFCEDTYVTPKGVWSWDWRHIHWHIDIDIDIYSYMHKKLMIHFIQQAVLTTQIKAKSDTVLLIRLHHSKWLARSHQVFQHLKGLYFCKPIVGKSQYTFSNGIWDFFHILRDVNGYVS